MRNAHLWKQILSRGFDGDHIFETDSKSGLLHRVIIATSIVSPVTTDTKTFTWQTLNGLAVPFDRFWMEGVILNGDPDGARWGVLVESSVGDEETTLVCHTFFQVFHGKPKLIGASEFVITKDGYTAENQIRAHMNEDVIHRIGEVDAGKLCLGTASLVCHTLAILGCKNVTLQEEQNDPNAVYSAIRRHGKSKNNYRYHILVVHPPTNKDNPRKPPQEIGTIPLHMCRGHFAEYGEQFGKGKLFGKYEGRFYVPPHLKGNIDNGVVEKDYEVRV